MKTPNPLMLQGRVDDNITTMKKRLKIFEALNRPVIDYYKNKGKLYTVSTSTSLQNKKHLCLHLGEACLLIMFDSNVS